MFTLRDEGQPAENDGCGLYLQPAENERPNAQVKTASEIYGAGDFSLFARSRQQQLIEADAAARDLEARGKGQWAALGACREIEHGFARA